MAKTKVKVLAAVQYGEYSNITLDIDGVETQLALAYDEKYTGYIDKEVYLSRSADKDYILEPVKERAGE